MMINLESKLQRMTKNDLINSNKLINKKKMIKILMIKKVIGGYFDS